MSRTGVAPVDIAPLVWFRIAFAAILLWQIGLYFGLGWITAFWVRPRFHFTYYGFGWVQPWPAGGMYVHCALLAALAVCMLVGFLYRASAALCCLGFTYLFLLDQANYLNHVYLLCLVSFLMVFVPAHRSCSIDAWRRPWWRSRTVPAWGLWLLRAQVAIVYVFAAIAKMNADWLRGEPLRSWLAARPDVPVIGPLLRAEALVPAFAYGSLLLDLLAVPALLWRRTRAVAACALLLFHLLNWQLFDLGVFPWLMIAATVLFLPPEWLRRGRSAPAPAGSPLGRRKRRTLALVGAYLAVQVLVPLRLWLYPGNPSWTEQGHTFAWRMLVREKRGEIALYVVDPVRRQRWEVEMWRHITPFQRRKMATHPDMILQLAHRVAARHRLQGRTQAQVYARAVATLNDHPPQWLVDPRVDLAAVPRSLRPAPWIVPLGVEVAGHPVPSPTLGARFGIVPEGARRRREWAPDAERSGPHD